MGTYAERVQALTEALSKDELSRRRKARGDQIHQHMPASWLFKRGGIAK